MSIGILTGESPWALADDPRWPVPIVTASDVSDARAAFVADPFGIEHNGEWYLFFEFMNRDSGRGEIGVATSIDLLEWRYSGTVLAETFHLSYPAIYKVDGQFWMIPETWESGQVRLYKADNFPMKWTFDRVLLDQTLTDPTVYRNVNGGWTLLACEAEPTHNSTLLMFEAPDFFGPWKAVTPNPLVVGRPDQARPGGHVFKWEGELHRLGQDSSSRYGEALRSYPMRPPWTESSGDVLLATGDDWRSSGGHHADFHPLPRSEGLFAFVDGERSHGDPN